MKPVNDICSGYRHGRESQQGTAEALVRECEIALQERFREIAYLTLLLRQEEELRAPQTEEREWLRQVALTLLTLPPWWGLMPRSWRKKRRQTLLTEMGLFDAHGYLQRNPDVAATAADPLRHYLQHGINEGRSRSK